MFVRFAQALQPQNLKLEMLRRFLSALKILMRQYSVQKENFAGGPEARCGAQHRRLSDRWPAAEVRMNKKKRVQGFGVEGCVM
jgi:hypothetical protein